MVVAAVVFALTISALAVGIGHCGLFEFAETCSTPPYGHLSRSYPIFVSGGFCLSIGLSVETVDFCLPFNELCVAVLLKTQALCVGVCVFIDVFIFSQLFLLYLLIINNICSLR